MNPKELERAIKDLAYSMPNHNNINKTMKHIKDMNGFTNKAITNESKRTPGGIDVWLDTELGVEDLFEELKARLQKLQEETNEYGWRKALKESERDLEKWADNLERYSLKWGLIGTDTNTEA